MILCETLLWNQHDYDALSYMHNDYGALFCTGIMIMCLSLAGIMIMLLCLCPCWAIHLNAEAFLVLIGQDAEVARYYGLFVY